MFSSVIVKKDCNITNAETLVNTAGFYRANSELIYDNKRVNCKSIMGVLSLGYINGETITLHVEGPDEEEAAEAITKCLE